MQYHNMLKNKQEMEVKQRAAAVEKAKLLEQEKLKPKLTPEEEKTLKEEAAEKAAQELLKMENDEQIDRDEIKLSNNKVRMVR